MNQVSTISAQQLSQLIAQGNKIELIDVRTPVEYREVHATLARNVPLDQLDPCHLMKQRTGSVDEPLYVICKSGGRGAKAQQKFIESGFSNVINVEGGTDSWVAAGLPVVRGKKTMSLERQVRLVVGMFCAIGGIGSLVTGNVLWSIIPAFMGSGLVFAALTDSCMLGMLLAKMPWNNVKESKTCCGVN